MIEPAFVNTGVPSPGQIGCSVSEALAHARARLHAAAIDTAALDARLLLAAATGLTMTRMIADSRHPIGQRESQTFAAMVDRRLAGEPVARILGEKEFWGLPIGLNAATLVPRPETEIVVEAALEAIRHFQFGPRIHICDLGTGSGAILVALLCELPQAHGTAIDISAEALSQARINAERLGVAERIVFQLSGFDQAPAGRYDLVISNPPYVRSADLAGLMPEVRGFDPGLALDGGADGLDAYRAIARRLPDMVAPGGLIVLELGAGQADGVRALLEPHEMQVWAIRPDLAGIERALVARRRVQA